MTEFLEFVLNTIKEFARTIASIIVLLATLGMWAEGCIISSKAVECNPWFMLLIIVLFWPFLVVTGLFYQGLISWINPGWTGAGGGHDGLHYDGDN